MDFIANHLYHIYNQGNNRQPIFFNHGNYLYFLEKIKSHVAPYCHIMAWCLMPNHFHFLIGTDERSTMIKQIGSVKTTALGNGFRVMESSYCRGVNRQQKRSGSLFRQHTKAKCLTEEAFDFAAEPFMSAPDFLNIYPAVCFHYIHQNPVKARLVSSDVEWEFSSLRDYWGLRNGKLCNFELAQRWVGIQLEEVKSQHPVALEERQVAFLFVD